MCSCGHTKGEHGAGPKGDCLGACGHAEDGTWWTLFLERSYTKPQDCACVKFKKVLVLWSQSHLRGSI